MKRVALCIALVVLTGGLTAWSASAQACESGALDRMMTRYMGECSRQQSCTEWHQAFSAADPTQPSQTSTTSSTSGSKLLGTVADGLGSGVTRVLDSKVISALGHAMTSFWRSIFGATGPRYVELGQSLDGEVVTPATRTVYSLLPSPDNVRYVRLYHRGGQSRLTASVCAVDPLTRQVTHGPMVIDIPRNSTPGKYYPLDGPNKELVLNGVTARFIIVELQPRTYMRSFRYSLRVR